MLDFLKRRSREAILARPFPEPYRPIVARAVHLYGSLPEADRRELEGLVQLFLAEKRFEAAGGLALTDEIRVTIAAQACLLQLHREGDLFPELATVLVYPHPYVAHAQHREGAVVIDGREARAGESWSRDLVVLSWDTVQREVRGQHPGHNVVVHEFAHQLDAENGAPPLPSRARYAAWSRVLGEEYRALGEELARGLPSDIDAYGATNPAEFFAVVTEHFFERPRKLRDRHPALYEQLARFYRFDPAAL